MAKSGRLALAVSALVKFIVGVVAIAALLLWPAGTLHYAGGWRLMTVLFVPVFLMGVAMLIYSPSLLERRLKSKEQRAEQSILIRLSGLMFVVGFVVAGLDFRYGWSVVPQWVVITAMTVFVLSYLLFAEVARENEWLSRVVEVAEGQQVVSTGLYGIVRHPMYLASLMMFLAMPLVLGSWWALLPFGFYVPVIVSRTLDEERLLRCELAGYDDYCTKVRWRIIPFVW